MRRDPAAALAWITELLRAQGVPFVVCGGLAAIGYGSQRALNDIDLFVPGDRLAEVAALTAEHVTRPLARRVGGGWDQDYVQLERDGTTVEIAGDADLRILDALSGRWVPLAVDFETAVPVEVFGLVVPLMPLADLVLYERALDRPMDREDVAALTTGDAG